MEHPWYDELRDPSGRIRTHYKQLHAYWRGIPKRQAARMLDQSRSLFAGDYALDPLPRLLTGQEFRILRSGVEQRARAVREFLIDYYRRGRRWRKVLAPATLQAIVSRHHSSHLVGKLDPESLAFPFGPDIIRDGRGNWRVVEDSAGCLGGIGDLVASRKIMLRLVPAYRDLFACAPNPRSFFTDLADHYRRLAAERGGIALLCLTGVRRDDDHEEQRLERLFRAAGIDVFTGTNRKRRFWCDRDAAFFQRPGGKKQRVGYVILHESPEQVDVRTLLRLLKRTTKFGDVLNVRSRGGTDSRHLDFFNGGSLQAAILAGAVRTNFSPGTQFLNDKMFGLHVDAFIALYLRETPILTGLPSRPMAFLSRSGEWRLDQRHLSYVMRRKDDFVIKRVDQDGGHGVWIGRRQSRASAGKLASAIRREPEAFICQKFEHLSVLDRRIVDLRIHVQVDRDRIVISNTPWGRASWIDGDGKVNLGANGFTSPVVVV